VDAVDHTTESYPVSALQSMLANVIYLTDLNKRATEALDTNQTIPFNWIMGRAARVLIVVPPVKIEDYNGNFASQRLFTVQENSTEF
jgi:hypothetical protein